MTKVCKSRNVMKSLMKQLYFQSVSNHTVNFYQIKIYHKTMFLTLRPTSTSTQISYNENT